MRISDISSRFYRVLTVLTLALAGVFVPCLGGVAWGDEDESAEFSEALPSVEHVLILDVSGSMSSERPQWGQYGTFATGFTPGYCKFWQELLAPEAGLLNGDDPAMIYPCSFYGKREKQRQDLYAQASENLVLQNVAEKLQQRDAKGNALCPGPDSDGAMGNEGMLTGLRQAMEAAKSRSAAPFRFYWFLTDNGFDDSSEKLPEGFYEFLSSEGESSFAQVWFAPLRRLPEGQGDLVLYLAIQEDEPGSWRPEWSETLMDNVLNPRLNAMWPDEQFKRRFVDLRGTCANVGEDGIDLIAEVKGFQRCTVPLPEDAFNGKERWCSVSKAGSAEAGSQAFSLALLDNHAAAKSGYENAVSLRCKVRPPRGWNICNVNIKGGQIYRVVSSLSPEEEQTLQKGLRLEFGQAPTIAKGSWRGTKPIVWNIIADDAAKRVIAAHPGGVELELILRLPTTIDFTKLDEEQQSGLDKELFSEIANLDRLERFILQVEPDEMVVERAWVSDKPIHLCLSASEQNIWQLCMKGDLSGVARAIGGKLASSAVPDSLQAKVGDLLQGANGGGYLVLFLLGSLLLLVGLIFLVKFLVKRVKKMSLDAAQNKNNKKNNEEDLDDLYGGSDDYE